MPRSQGNVTISSYTRGGAYEEGSYAGEKLSKLLQDYNVVAGEAEVEVTGADGEERRTAVTMVLREDDTIIIMKKKNKSGL